MLFSLFCPHQYKLTFVQLQLIFVMESIMSALLSKKADLNKRKRLSGPKMYGIKTRHNFFHEMPIKLVFKTCVYVSPQNEW